MPNAGHDLNGEPPGEAPSPIREQPKPIVVGVDGSDGSLCALDWATDEAHRRGVDLVVLHANFWTDEALRLGVFDEQRRLERAVVEIAVDRARERWPDITVLGHVCTPPADEALVAASRDALLVVVGARGLGVIDNLVLGSVSHYVVRHSHCPVVVVPNPSDRARSDGPPNADPN